jgi:hypothetical protein
MVLLEQLEAEGVVVHGGVVRLRLPGADGVEDTAITPAKLTETLRGKLGIEA